MTDPKYPPDEEPWEGDEDDEYIAIDIGEMYDRVEGDELNAK